MSTTTMEKPKNLVERPVFKAQYDNFIGGRWVKPVKGEYFEKNATSLRVNMEELCESLNVAMLATIVAHQMFTKKIKVK